MYVSDTTVDTPSGGTPSLPQQAANAVRLRPTLLGIASAHPPFEVTMQDSWELLFQHMSPPVRFGRRIVESTSVQKRHIMWRPDTLLEACDMLTGARMAAHADAVIEVASRSIDQAIEGVEQAPHRQLRDGLLDRLRQSRSRPAASQTAWAAVRSAAHLHRPHGLLCGANVIKVAMDSVAARPDELVICNCTELSSAHVRSSPMADEDPTESLITQALFGDASVTMLMGSAPDGTGVQFLRTHTEQLYDEHQMMSLNIGNQSFWMTLSAGVPTVLQENIEDFLVKLLQPLGLSAGDVSHWGIHPGGPKILRVLGRQLALEPAQLRASWDVLANNGNCASATVLLVLENILRVDKPARGEYGVLLTFGPGLTIEGAVIRF